MILEKLILIDFGIYQGKIEIDLTPKNKPIIIFGGNNGSGKTTLLEAIKLCLYGPRALGIRTTKSEYEEFIIKKIHRKRNSVVKLNSTSVSLSFNYSMYGTNQQYEVFRSWKHKLGKLHENLIINLNGNKLKNVSEEHWQNYIDDLLPPSIADLFFFDGEKIQSLAFENFNDQNISTEIKRLLGINIIEKLLADLEIYQNRQKKENSYDDLLHNLETEESFFKAKELDYLKKMQELSSVQNKIDNLKGRIENLELQISRESSGFAFSREALRKQQIRTSLEIEFVEKKIFELASGLLPFTLTPKLVSELKDQLQSEEINQKKLSANDLIKPKIIKLKKRLNSDDLWSMVNGNISTSTKTQIIQEISKLLDELDVSNPNENETEIIHFLSERERFQIHNWINEILDETPNKLKDISTELENLEYLHQDITVKLQNVPDDDVLNPIMKKINILNMELGETLAVYKKIEGEKDNLAMQKDEAERNVKRAYESLRVGKRILQRLDMVQNSKEILSIYLTETTRKKTNLLEILLVEKFRLLSRKQDLVLKSSINSQSYSIDLFDNEGALIPKDFLSAGEKQMFAIALLWALRDLSGKSFPVIIDTPLGRLDSEHRDLLIKEYFPNVSHQVILFSTDTEVNQKYYKSLEPRISHTYQLIYDSNSGKTNLSNGYFGK